MSSLLIAICILTVAIVVGVLVTIARNHVSHQFFKIKSPNLPVIPNPSLLGGHLNQINFNKRNWQEIDRLHKQYGKTFGFFYNDRPMVSTIDLDLIKEIVLDDPDANIDRMTIGGPIDEFERDTISMADGNQWRRLRKAIAPAFALHKIKSANVQAEFKAVIDKFVASIGRRLVKAKKERNEDFIVEDAEDIFHRYALALVFTCFYKQDNMIDFDSDKDSYVDMICKAFRNMVNTPLKLCIYFPILKPILSLLINFHPLGKMRTTIVGFIKEQTKLNSDATRHLESMKKLTSKMGEFDEDNFILENKQKFSRNLVDFIIDQYQEGKLTPTEYLHSTYFLFFAANKTSADSMSKLVYQLACHQGVQDKLRETILHEGLDSEYLGWVLNESMRLFPPTLIGCSRKLSHGIRNKEGVLIPAGAFVYTAAWTIHHSPEIWGPDVEEFKPERWKDVKSFHPVQNLTFGAGRRACPGKDFALVEIKLLLNVMLRKFKFERSSETTDSMLFTSPDFVFTMSELPTYVKITPLKNAY